MLKAEGVRTAGDPARVVRCVAVCTGAGLMVKEALRAGAEVIVTGTSSTTRLPRPWARAFGWWTPALRNRTTGRKTAVCGFTTEV